MNAELSVSGMPVEQYIHSVVTVLGVDSPSIREQARFYSFIIGNPEWAAVVIFRELQGPNASDRVREFAVKLGFSPYESY